MKNNTPDIDLRSLQSFIIVVETNSMSDTAQIMGITQSAVSQVIRKLEKSLATQLVDRSTRPMTITAKGHFFYQRAKSLINDANELQSLMTDGTRQILPRLRLGMVHSFAATVGPKLVRSFADTAEAWSISSGLTARHEQSLLMREIDILVVEGELAHIYGIERYKLLTEPLILVTPKSYKGATDSLSKINKHLSLVCYSPNSMTGKLAAETLRKRNINPEKTIEFDSTDGLLSLVSEGNYWTITTPLCIMQSSQFASSLCFHCLPGKAATRTLTLITRQHELGSLPLHLSHAARDVLTKQLFPFVKKLMPWVAESISVE